MMQPETATISQADAQAAGPSFRWVVCALLFFATTINYMDRQILGILAPQLKKEIGWNDLQYSHIVIAFQAAYAIGAILFGGLIDRWGTKKGYSLAILIWSAAAALHGAAHSVAAFASARFLLGIGESGNFPSAIKTVAEWFPKKQRSLATGLFNSGCNIGAILGPAVVPPLALACGWRAAFLIVGITGFVWVLAWLFLYSTPQDHPNISKSDLEFLHAGDELSLAHGQIGWRRLMRFPQTWANIFQSALISPIWWFFIYWLPTYLHDTFNLSLSTIGPPLVIVYSMTFVGSIAGGWLPNLFLKRGCSLNLSRKASFFICAALTIPVAFVTKIPNMWETTFVIGVALAGTQAWSANSYTMISDLFPKGAVATLVAIGTAAGGIASIAFSELVGKILGKTGNYTPLFILAGVAYPSALLVIHFLIPRWQSIPLKTDAL